MATGRFKNHPDARVDASSRLFIKNSLSLSHAKGGKCQAKRLMMTHKGLPNSPPGASAVAPAGGKERELLHRWQEMSREMACYVAQAARNVPAAHLSRAEDTGEPQVWCMYRGTSLIRNCFLLGLYSRPMPRALWWF